MRSTQTIAEVQPRDITAPELTKCATSSATKEQLGFLAEARTPNDRKLFREIIQNLAALDRRSTTEADEFTDYALWHYAAQMRDRPSVLPVLKRFFGYGLEWPAELRTRLSERVNMSAAQTYGDAAEAAYVALLDAAKPVLIEAMGDLSLPDAARSLSI